MAALNTTKVTAVPVVQAGEIDRYNGPTIEDALNSLSGVRVADANPFLPSGDYDGFLDTPEGREWTQTGGKLGYGYGGKDRLVMDFGSKNGELPPSKVYRFVSDYVDKHPNATDDEIEAAYNKSTARQAWLKKENAHTAQLNRSSVIRESSIPIYEVELNSTVAGVLQGTENVVKDSILNLADMTVLPLADTLQIVPKMMEAVVTGNPADLTPVSSYGSKVVNDGAGFWDGVKGTARNVYNISPIGMIHHSYTGGGDLGNAIRTGNVVKGTEASLGLAMNFAGAKAAGMDRFGFIIKDIGGPKYGPLAKQRGSVNISFGRVDGANSSTAPKSTIKYGVGSYSDIKGTTSGLDAHHVGQKALMRDLIPDYDPSTAPAILVPKIGHTIRGPKGIVSRSTNGLTTARDVLARDINELRRVYPDIPNSQLQQLIRMNKDTYPNSFEK